MKKGKDSSSAGFTIHRVWRADTPEAIATWKALFPALCEDEAWPGGDASLDDTRAPLVPDAEKREELGPEVFDPYGNTGTHVRLRKKLLDDVIPLQPVDSAVVVVGHQPLLGWVAYELTGKSVPLDHSGVACIAIPEKRRFLRRRGRLLWVLSAAGETAAAQLMEKIKSKMDVAKLLGGFISGVLAFLLASLMDDDRMGYLGDNRWTFYAATALFLAAVGLYFATMYAYDRLLMPRQFWGEDRPPKRHRWLVWRPPSPSSWILYQNMMRIWCWLFTPATYAVVLGLVLLAYGAFKPERAYVWSFWVTAVAAGALFGAYYVRFGPRIGSDD